MVTGASSDPFVAHIRRWVENEVLPVARELELADAYPHDLVRQMQAMGLFGAIIPPEYGGAGLDFSTYAALIEEISRGWMSLTGILNSHLIMAYTVLTNGAEDQRRRWLPRMATGELRGGIGLTEPNAGSDLQAIRTTAVRDGDEYIINGHKLFITNGLHGNTFALLTKTDPGASQRHRGMSLFIVQKGEPGCGFSVGQKFQKLGYRGVDTVELLFEDFRVPAANLIGSAEGLGFKQIMSGLEVGRINVAARGIGVARAAFEAAIKYAQQRETMGKPIAEHQVIQIKLAEMATRLEAARLLVRQAGQKKDAGERCDLEAGMAKLFATETAQFCALEAMRIHGGVAYMQDLTIERYYRDAPLLLIGEGTNEIQSIVIARQLLERYKV